MKLGRPQWSRSRERALEDAVLPLINIVFLLMIFFLLAGKASERMQAEAAPQSWLSEKTSAAAPKWLRLLPDDAIDANGVLISDAGLAQEALRWAGAAVDVEADASIAAERVLRVLNTLNAAGAGEVRLMTRKPQ